ncbi:TonB-dependent receptor [uncultured Paraglaciecola sp.]|uniref:TonB-dependent receptor n=1 Tax=uncultured Paraglaciecola sp. TaxID=1765024 RepID=UPI0025CC6317|nr:TonB-dependent receptor [uncultured Paraglaciecola sp.]
MFSTLGIASEQKLYQFDIPQQPLAKSLNALSDHTKTLVLFPYDLVDNRQGNIVKGQYTLVQAIDRLLHNTGLFGGLSKKEVVMIREQQSSSQNNTNNNNGNTNMKTKKSILATTLAFLFSGATVSGSALAQDAPKQDQEEQAEVISILGTRGAPRTVTDSPVAIDVFSGEEFTANGNTADITDNLKSLVPSFTATPATGDGSAFIRPTSLRGMAPDQTLILVNGKRRHRSSLVQFFAPAAGNGAHGVDIGMIPSIALKSVEVLRDGAAAQYGSDAIAGVMNFQLKDASEGGSVVAQYGEFYEGEQSWIVGANAGFALGTDGFFNISFETNDNEALSRGIQRADGQQLIDDGVQGVGSDSPFGDEPFVQSWGRPETSGTRVAFNTGYEINDAVELYMHGGYADTDGRYRFFYRNPGHSTLSGVTSLPAGYTPFLDGAQKDTSLIAGFKGETSSELTYNFSAGFGKNELAYYLNNTVNSGLTVDGVLGQRDFDMGGYEQEETNLNADFSMPLSDDVFLGFGAEWREETFTTLAGEAASLISPGPSGMTSVTPADAGEFSRDNIAVYVDAEYNVSDDLLVQGALRYEDFSDFGGTINSKLAGRYNVSDDFVIRGAISTGFHAPTPGQANITSIITTFDGTTGAQIEEGLVRADNPLAIANGAQELKEEESVSLSLGFTYSGFENGNLSVDFYNTKVDDRIYRTGNIPADTGGTVSFFTNALDVEHQGLDLVYTTSMDWGNSAESKFTFAYNHNTIDVVGQSLVNGIQPVSDASVEDIENNYPENRFVATAVTDFSDNYQVMLRANFYGEHYDERGTINDASSPSALVDSVVFFDMEFNYFASEDFTLTAGVSNIFDTFVDEIGAGNANRLSVGLQYPRRTPANYEGGSWYLRAKYEF